MKKSKFGNLGVALNNIKNMKNEVLFDPPVSNESKFYNEVISSLFVYDIQTYSGLKNIDNQNKQTSDLWYNWWDQ